MTLGDLFDALFPHLFSTIISSKLATPQSTSFFETSTLWFQKKKQSLNATSNQDITCFFRIAHLAKSPKSNPFCSWREILKPSQTCSSTFFENPVYETPVLRANNNIPIPTLFDLLKNFWPEAVFWYHPKTETHTPAAHPAAQEDTPTENIGDCYWTPKAHNPTHTHPYQNPPPPASPTPNRREAGRKQREAATEPATHRKPAQTEKENFLFRFWKKN